MPAWLRVTLLLVVLAVVAGAAVLIRTFQHVSGDIGKDMDEGSAFGRGKDANVCVNEALARAASRCTTFDMACTTKMQTFLQGCLRSADQTQGLCSSVPKYRPFSLPDRWLAEECARRGYKGSQRCQIVMATLQIYCSQNKR